MCQKNPSCSSCSISASESAVIHFGHQLVILFPLYIRPSLYNFTKTSLTALFKFSSMVKASRVKSAEHPIFLSCSLILSLYSSVHSQTFSRKASLPISFFFNPFLRSAFSTLTSVAMLAWSSPGSQRVLYPCILLVLIKIS